MEQTPPLTPRLSVIVPALVGYEAVRAVLAALEAQTKRREFELVIICPERGDWVAKHPSATIVEVGALRLHRARAAGVRAARAPFVLLAEDHCIPDPGCVEALLARLEEPLDGIGPVLRSGNPSTLVAQGSFLIGYGEWIAPVRPGPPRALPGHNAVLRRSGLLARGDHLDDDLLMSALLLRQLQVGGARFTIEPGATMRHYDAAALGTSLLIMFCVGTGFGAQRSASWPWWTRAVYALAAPALGVLHWARAVRQYRRVGRDARLSPWCLVPAAAFAIAWGAGESAGSALGARRVEPCVSIAELNKMSYVRPADRP